MGRIDGKIVLITGTGGGQGREAARLFAREGAVVIGCDINSEGAAETEKLVEADGYKMESTAPVDLSELDQLRRWIDDAASVHGRIDVLYNNAGLCRFAPFEQMEVDDYTFTVRNELDLVWHACQRAWPYLTAAGGGAIVNIASVAGLIGTRDLTSAAHAATKGAVISLTRQLAAEGAAVGIRVNSISPGLIAVPTVQDAIDQMGDQVPFQSLVSATSTGIPGTALDVAYAALYLASDEARFVNGSNLVIDGGTTVLVG